MRPAEPRQSSLRLLLLPKAFHSAAFPLGLVLSPEQARRRRHCPRFSPLLLQLLLLL